MTGLILPYRGVMPSIAADAFVAPNATVVGDVEIGPGASIWYNVVLRGDSAPIRIGRNTNIQDAAVVHVDDGNPAMMGEDVLIGHMAVVEGCTLGDRAFIGMKACVLPGAVVESGAMVAAGALVTSGKVVPSGQLWAGAPARYMRELTDADRAAMAGAVRHYLEFARDHGAALAARERAGS